MLGPLTAHDEVGVVNLGGPRQRTVLALLLVAANKVVTTDRLIDELYGEKPPESARKSLQSYVANLRKAVNTQQELLQSRPPGYVLEVDTAQVDALDFERLVHQARATLDSDPAVSRDRLTDALQLWYGAPLVDVADEAPSLRQEVVRLTELRLAAIEDRIEADLALGQHHTATVELESLTVEHPLRERLWGQLMLALYRSGRQAEALRAYQKARRILGEELGIEPSPSLRNLEDRILAHDVGLEATDPSPAAVEALPGRRIRGYELRERVGEGRLGSVYRAYQPAMGREVALEVTRPDLAGGAEFARRFEADAALIARLEHPHIVPLYDYWREPGGAFVVSRWMRGGSLAGALERGSWRLDAVARFIRQAGSALGMAHRHGVVHGNVTPHNILLDDDGNTYVGSFPIGIGSHDGAAEKPWDEVADPGRDTRDLALAALQALTGQQSVPEVPEPQSGEIDSDLLDVLRTAIEPGPDGGYPDTAAFVEDFLDASESLETLTTAPTLSLIHI